ncbi:MAG TPA: acyl-CoA thioesterase domain-containing protein [Mycobacteriales bacterium]|jgi:acyl-CoA thioesterase|nr:acyl-CoA thioesterase domain-containing protein [Mycobacteriales bacterium]
MDLTAQPWGDAQLLLDVMAVRRVGDRQFVGRDIRDERRPVVEGSQMLGQAIVAAGDIAPGRRVVSGYMNFMRVADSREEMIFDVEEAFGGRSFSSLVVRVSQNERLCAVGVLLLDVMAPDLIRHSAAPPSCPPPEDCSPVDMGVIGRDIRVADDAYTGDPEAPVGPPVIDAWVRYRALPDASSAMHAGLLAQFMGHMSIAAALRPHGGVGQAAAHQTMSTAINAISLSIHSDVRVDQWLRYRHESTFAGDGMTHAECRVHDEGDQLLASFTVDGMVRGFASSNAGGNPQTAL